MIDTQSARTRWGWIALLAILVLAAALRLYRIDAHSLWIDEVYSYLSASGHGFREYTAIPQNVVLDHAPALTERASAKPWYAALRPDYDDVHPPTFFFLSRLWLNAFGWGGWELRLFAALASTVAVALLYAAVREWSGVATGLAAALIMAVAQPQIRMGQEARAYSLVLAVALGAAWALARIERRGISRWRMVTLATLCLLLPLLHYFSLAIVATLALYALIRLRGKVRLLALGATVGPAILFAIAWFPVLYHQAHGASSSGTTVFVDAAEHHYRETFFRLAMIPTRALYEPLPSEQRVALILSLICLLPLLTLRRRPDLLIWVIWLPMNIAPALLNDLTHDSWTLEIERYTLPATLAIYALLAGVGTLVPRNAGFVVALIAALGAGVHLDQTYEFEDRKASQKWRTLAADYMQMARPGDLTLFADTADPPHAFIYFLCIEHYAHPLPGPILLATRQASPELMRQIRTHRVMLVGTLDAYQYFPGARIVDQHAIPFLGTVAVLAFD